MALQGADWFKMYKLMWYEQLRGSAPDPSIPQSRVMNRSIDNDVWDSVCSIGLSANFLCVGVGHPPCNPFLHKCYSLFPSLAFVLELWRELGQGPGQGPEGTFRGPSVIFAQHYWKKVILKHVRVVCYRGFNIRKGTRRFIWKLFR